jgi:solute carrier family 39 (zinc transporter), member 1/2/3
VIQHHDTPITPDETRSIISKKCKDVRKQSSSSCDAENNVQSSCCKEQREREIEHEIVNEGICHTAHQERCRDSITGIIGMLTALFVHSILEGLAIGVQAKEQDVWILFTAVISHKLVVAFCLGVELTASHGSRLRNHFLAILVFALGSVFGIILGIILCDFKFITESKALPILQALAGGTLLNVTLCEVMPREKARWHQKEGNKSAGLFQFVAFACGFSIMTLLTFYLGHEHAAAHSHDHGGGLLHDHTHDHDHDHPHH